jgi:hypothetical protein
MPLRPVPVRSSDSAVGSESQFTNHPFGSDSAAGTENQFLVWQITSADAGAATDNQTASLAFSSSDSAVGTDSQSSPVFLIRDFDGAVGTESAFHLPVAPTGITGVAMEGFSLTRASVLGATGTENVNLYGAQTITLTPDVTVINNSADDDVISIWVIMNSATIAVTAGFMPFTTIAQLGGTAVVSSGLSPSDYYGLPLWTQYQHNQPQVPMAIRMASRNSPGAARTMDVVLYRVSIAVLDFTGIVYKTGLQVNYTGKVMFSSTDEVGNTLAGPEIGRVVSYAGNLTGAFAGLPFRGV